MPAKTEYTKAVAARKRNRKRKRRLASSSSSSSPSSVSASSSDGEVALTIKRHLSNRPAPSDSSDPSSSSSPSDSEDDHGEAPHVSAPATQKRVSSPQGPPSPIQQHQRRSPSVTPPPAPIPSFLPSKTSPSTGEKNEQDLKDRFRKFWMASMADGFKDDLDQIRKEPGLTTSRLAMLIDSLASGADLYASSAASGSRDANEMEVVLDS